MYDFDTGVKRKGTNCVKWDVPFITEEVTPMWIADMDFEIAPAITENLRKTAGQGAFGYQFLSEKYYQAVIDWMERRHHYPVTREEICFVPNVVMGIGYAIQAVSEPGDEIIIQTPVYGPFFDSVKDTDRALVESQMRQTDGYYTMDLEDFESKITPKTKATILCNPHNPSGRVWTREELLKLADICMKHGLYIISDDIHSELVRKECTHTFISLLSEQIRDRCIICTSPSKAFNLAGIHVANCFISNKNVRERFESIARKLHAAESNAFVEAALLGAYNESEKWLEELNVYIEENVNCFVDYIHQYIPSLRVCRPEGTYLVWVDFSHTEVPVGQLREYLLKECHVAVNAGEFFGKDGQGYVRFNLACPRDSVRRVLEALREKLG